MDNLQAIKANISDAHGVVLTESHFVKALRDVGLNEVHAYSSAAAIDKATLQLYDNVIIPGASFTEGSFSYTASPALQRARDQIAERLGVLDRKDTINRASVW